MPRRIRVLALAPLPSRRAGTRHRVEQYIPLLRSAGIDVEVSSFFDESAHRVLYVPGHTVAKAFGVLRGTWRRVRDLFRARRFDVLLVYRETTAFGPPVFEWLLRRMGVRYVFDFDDAIYLTGTSSVNKRWSWLRHPSRVAGSARLATAVIVSNDYLADHARTWNDRVTAIMTPVDTDRHTPRSAPRPNGPLVIGWAGSQWTAPYLRLLDDALTQLARRREFIFRVVGGEYSNPNARVEVLEFDVDREADDLRSFDIGVLPEPDEEWTKGKGAYKGLLYMATGLPVVASRVGVNPEVILEGQTGYCVGTTAEWVEALERLLDDATLRQRLGTNGRRRAEERYSVRVQAPRVARILLDAAGVPEAERSLP
jgi:glycosyltransferase involved in cell wall biosynthesis